MQHINIHYFKTPVGELILGSYNNSLCLADWRFRKMRTAIDERIQKKLNAGYTEGEDEVLAETRNQLDQYFTGERKAFELPLLFAGTDFQKTVWNALLEVEYGTTSTYLRLSEKLNNKDAIRAVASANGANAISIIVPCHRIIGSDGELVGYAGGLPAKQKLLELENSDIMKAKAAQTALEL
ncbi:MAG: methylated-DNA--[protein]-cysteine S-methyltransferase [Bacteroidota bacterium]|jgi:methylated-DNA-[protein]-cysteine S-methyltransferase